MTDVLLLTEPACGLCDHAKAVLARIGQDHPLTVVEIPLTSVVGHQMAANMGVLFAPGVVVDGQLFAHGRLSEKKLRRHLSAVNTATAKPRRT